MDFKIIILAFLCIDLSMVINSVADEAPEQGRLDAAFASHDVAILIKGTEALSLKGFKQNRIESLERLLLPESFKIQAAFLLRNPDRIYFFGPKYGIKLFNDDRDELRNKTLRYGKIRKFLQGGGPDAAGKMDGKVYIFKGCEVVERKSWNRWSRPERLPDLGLPCDVDAAWGFYQDPTVMNVVKGDQLWLWSRNNVTGPVDFHSMYQLDTWKLKP